MSPAALIPDYVTYMLLAVLIVHANTHLLFMMVGIGSPVDIADIRASFTHQSAFFQDKTPRQGTGQLSSQDMDAYLAIFKCFARSSRSFEKTKSLAVYAPMHRPCTLGPPLFDGHGVWYRVHNPLESRRNLECCCCTCGSQPIWIWRIWDHPDPSWDQWCTVGSDSTRMIMLHTMPPQLLNVVCTLTHLCAIWQDGCFTLLTWAQSAWRHGHGVPETACQYQRMLCDALIPNYHVYCCCQIHYL